MYYSTFDLIFKSKDLLLPELQLIDLKNRNYDVLIQKDNFKNWPPIEKGRYDTEFLKMATNDFRLSIKGIAEFRVIDGNKIYWSKANNKVTENDIKAFLFSSVFGALFIQRDNLLLHGNALTKNKKLIICLGKSGVGKSTISYILMKNGWKLVSDDLVLIKNNSDVSIGIQRIKLWKNTLNTLNIKHSELEKVRPNINKYFIKKSDLNLAKETYPISSIYILYSENDIKHNNKNLNMINIKKEQTKLFLLRENIFRPRIVKGLGKEAKYFSQLTEIIKTCPISLLPLPNGIIKMENFLINTFNKVAIENR